MADVMTMGPAVVTQVGIFAGRGSPFGTPNRDYTTGAPLAHASESTNFLLVAVSVVIVAVRAILAAVNCCRTAVWFVAAKARLSNVVPNVSIAVGVGPG